MRSAAAIACVALASVLFLAGCAHPPAARTSNVDKLRPEQLKSLLAREKNLFFLDVRSPKEIRELGALPGYVNIPIEQLEHRLAELPRHRTIVTS